MQVYLSRCPRFEHTEEEIYVCFPSVCSLLLEEVTGRDAVPTWYLTYYFTIDKLHCYGIIRCLPEWKENGVFARHKMFCSGFS